MTRVRARRARVIALAAILAISSAPAFAQQKPRSSEAPKAADIPAKVSSPATSPPSTDAAPSVSASGEAASVYRVVGFRSARFGMDEAEVRAAIAKDLGVQPAAITKTQNLMDRTDILTVRAPDLLQGGGTADVAYVFGYQSKKLIQVSAVWSKASDKSLEAQQLIANGEALKGYFAGENFASGSVATDLAVRDGIILFRGTDADSRAIAVMLRGAITDNAQDKTQKTFTPASLVLSYIADAKTPDVFKIQSGRF